MTTLIFTFGLFMCLFAGFILLVKLGSAFVGLMFSAFSGLFSLIGGLVSAVFGLLAGMVSAVAGLVVAVVIVPLVLFVVGLGLMMPVLIPLALVFGFIWLLAKLITPSAPTQALQPAP